MIISIDFDGTIVEHAFPEIGEPLEGAFETLKALSEAGHVLVLNTCREDTPGRYYHLTEAIEFCKANGVEFHSHNENHPDIVRHILMEEDLLDKTVARKVYADIYIDDRNIGGFIGWNKVREIILGK